MEKLHFDPWLKKTLIKLSVPIIIQEVAAMLILTLSTLILSTFSKEVVNGIAPITQIYFLFNNILLGFSFIGNLFISQHYGRGNIEKVEKDYYLIIKLSIILSLIFFFVMFFAPKQIVSLFLAKDATFDKSLIYAERYSKIFSFSFIFSGLITVNSCLMKNIRLEKQSMFITIGALLVFVLLDTLFLFFIMPQKVEGSATAYLITRILEWSVGIYFIFYKKRNFFNFSFKSFIKFDKEINSSFIRYGLAVFIGKTLFAFGAMFCTLLVGQLNNSDLTAANSLMGNMKNIITCLTNGFAGAVSIVIGRELGANRTSKADYHSQILIRMLIFVSIIPIILFYLTLPINILVTKAGGNYGEDIVKYLVYIYLINSFGLYAQAFNTVIINGMLNAGGDTIYICIIDSVTNTFLLVPLAFLGIKLNWNPILILIILSIDEIVKCPMNIYRWKQKKWSKNVINTEGIVFKE